MSIWDELNEFDSAEISDALDACGIEGALTHLKPLLQGHKLIGSEYTVKYAAYDVKPDTFQNAGNYIDEVPAGSVVVIDNAGREDCTTWGDILTQVAIKRKLAGAVVNGAIRDVRYIKSVNFPVFSKAIFMRSGKNRVLKVAQQCSLTIGSVTVKPGDIIFGDDNGVLAIPKEKLIEVLIKANNIKLTESDIINAIAKGMPLSAARKRYRYDQPWLVDEKKHA